jgi:hypothetical protein
VTIWNCLRAFGGIDEIVVRSDSIQLTKHAYFLKRHQTIPRDTIRQIYCGASGLLRPIWIATAKRNIVLTTFCSLTEAEALQVELSRTLGLESSHTSQLPRGWEEIPIPEGGTAMVKSRAMRRRSALITTCLGLIFLGFGIIAFYNAPIAIGLILSGLAACILAGAYRLFFIQDEWICSHGKLTLQRRSGNTTRVLFSGNHLILDVVSDSDGDDWYTVVVEDLTATRVTAKRQSKVIMREMQPAGPRALANWLAEKTALALENHTTTESQIARQQAEYERLAQSGKIGSMIASLLAKPPQK